MYRRVDSSKEDGRGKLSVHRLCALDLYLQGWRDRSVVKRSKVTTQMASQLVTFNDQRWVTGTLNTEKLGFGESFGIQVVISDLVSRG